MYLFALTFGHGLVHVERIALEIQDIAVVIEVDDQVAHVAGIGRGLDDEDAVAGAVDHLGGVIAGGAVRTRRITGVEEGVRVGAHDDVDPVAGIGRDLLVHIVATV